MSNETRTMKVAKTSIEEITTLMDILNEIESFYKYEHGFDGGDLSEYKILNSFSKDEPEEFINDLFRHLANIHFQRILFNCLTLLENCADPDQDTLDFNPRIKKALELLEETEYTS